MIQAKTQALASPSVEATDEAKSPSESLPEGSEYSSSELMPDGWAHWNLVRRHQHHGLRLELKLSDASENAPKAAPQWLGRRTGSARSRAVGDRQVPRVELDPSLLGLDPVVPESEELVGNLHLLQLDLAHRMGVDTPTRQTDLSKENG